MSNFIVDYGANNGEIVSTLNYLLSNLGNAPFGLTINKINGEILNVGTNTVTGYLYQYLNITWANNIQGLYFSNTQANQAFYGIQNTNTPTFGTANTDYTWRAIPTPGKIGPANGVFLWYSVQGGRQITFQFAATAPDPSYVKYVDNTSINLDVITFVGNSSIIGNNTVIGNYATIGTHATIGDYWTAGNSGNIGSNLTVGANATIGSNLTVSGLITNSVLNTDTVGTTQLVNLSVTNAKLANNSVTTGKIANYTIIDQDIANLTITGTKIVDYTLVGTKLANATVDTQQITPLAITNALLANDAVTTDKIQDYTIVGTDLANATVTSQQIQDYTIVDSDIANLTITGSSVANYTLVGTKLANATVGSQQITDYSITATDIANLTITGSQVANYTLAGTKLANATVGSQQITDYSITGTDLANATVTNQQVASYTLTGTNLANLTITGSQVANSTLDQTKLNIATLSSITANAGNITSGTITGVGQGGTTLITGYTTGITSSLSNVALTNKSATTLTTYTVNTSQPYGVRLMMALSGTVNHWGNETTNGVYDAMSGNVIFDILYSNSVAFLSSTTFAQGGVTMIRQSGTSYDYRFYVPVPNTQSQRMVNDTYTFRLTPWWFYRNNSTGNLVTPTNDTLTFNGRLAIFQANIS